MKKENIGDSMTCRISEYNKVSLSSKIILGILRLTYITIRKKFLYFAFSLKRKDFKVPKFISKKYKLVKQQIFNNYIATVFPKQQETEIHILYFHGGAYIAPGSVVHWLLISKIIDSVKCKVTYVDYPLAPESNYKDTFTMVNKTYKELLKTYTSDKFIFAGDSAGGGLALAYAQSIIKDNKLKKPVGLILLSPWLDLTMKNPEICNYEDKDVLLSSKLLLKAAKIYAAGDNMESELLSPINGELDGLGRILVLSGTSDLLYPDCEKLKENAKYTDTFIEFSIYKGMPHVWILLFLKESKAAIKEICEFLNAT